MASRSYAVYWYIILIRNVLMKYILYDYFPADDSVLLGANIWDVAMTALALYALYCTCILSPYIRRGIATLLCSNKFIGTKVCSLIE